MAIQLCVGFFLALIMCSFKVTSPILSEICYLYASLGELVGHICKMMLLPPLRL